MPAPAADAFIDRHLGPDDAEVGEMLAAVGLSSLDELVEEAVPPAIRLQRSLALPEPMTEPEALAELRRIADANRVRRPLIGMGYHDTHTPPVVLRNVLENPGWYTAYTPYQAEISQGRLEALLVYQTVVQELTGMDIANASMLDEATAAAEAMTMILRLNRKNKATSFFVDVDTHPQTIAVIQTRAEPLGLEVVVGDPVDFDPAQMPVFGALVSYPGSSGTVRSNLAELIERFHAAGAQVAVATDLLACTLVTPPGELGADHVLGNSQRFGVPLGYGGPHAAFLATRSGSQRQMPGRIIGVSVDAEGHPALRMALQTREQHIRRQRATSNICTAQVLLAVCAGMYAVWHGPEGLRRIAERVHWHARALATALRAAGHEVDGPFFDTLTVTLADGDAAGRVAAAAAAGFLLRSRSDGRVGIALDEVVTTEQLGELASVFGAQLGEPEGEELPDELRRRTPFLADPVFHRHRSETEMLRYLHRLQVRDIALDTSMIPLGSCTMKLNATTEMIPVTWSGFNGLHPFAPTDDAAGYQQLFADLRAWLADCTGFADVSLQPNAGSQGEYSGLLTIRAYHRSRGEGHRHVCLIPTSAHGTNPASAVMAGMKVVTVACDDHGNIDTDDLQAKAEAHSDELAALMVTYPSTHGVFEEAIASICEVIHRHGGQVYLDGANMNAMVGLCRPGDFGADVCHLNLHKTFCIPHGGGGPGMGPIGVAEHLVPFVPGHPLGGDDQVAGPVSAAPAGSPSILPITWAYIRMLGAEGLTRASQVAILGANYIAQRLSPHYPVLYRGRRGRVAHECILDLRPFKAAGIQVDDVAKRLMDYGFHAPTMSFPVAGTLMIEPTESESKAELDRFCDAMIAIREEIRAVEKGLSPEDSPLRHAPHTVAAVTADRWERPYTRQVAAFPAPWLMIHKPWPAVARIDNATGDRNLICSCDAWPTE